MEKVNKRNCESGSPLEFWFEPSMQEIDFIFSHLGKARSVFDKNRVCYIYGEGKQPQSIYTDLEVQGAKVVWKGFKGPFWARILSPIASSTYGLIKVNESNSIKSFLITLSHLSAVSFYSFKKELEKNFIEVVTHGGWEVNPINIIRNDPSHFVFTLDGDNNETESGLLVIIRFGDDCPEDLKSIVRNFGEVGYIGQKLL